MCVTFCYLEGRPDSAKDAFLRTMLKHHSLRVISFEEPEVFVSVDASCQKLLLLLLQLRVNEVKHMGHAFGVRVGHRVRHVV